MISGSPFACIVRFSLEIRREFIGCGRGERALLRLLSGDPAQADQWRQKKRGLNIRKPFHQSLLRYKISLARALNAAVVCGRCFLTMSRNSFIRSGSDFAMRAATVIANVRTATGSHASSTRSTQWA